MALFYDTTFYNGIILLKILWVQLFIYWEISISISSFKDILELTRMELTRFDWTYKPILNRILSIIRQLQSTNFTCVWASFTVTSFCEFNEFDWASSWDTANLAISFTLSLFGSAFFFPPKIPYMYEQTKFKRTFDWHFVLWTHIE